MQESKTTQFEAKGFFTLDQRKGHWWLITPDGRPFFSMGVNHIDPATMRYLENIELWRNKYDGSTIKWIQKSVAPNLTQWGFNSMQMTQTQKRQFFEEGYLIVRGAIPKLMVEQARKAINHHMGSHVNGCDG